VTGRRRISQKQTMIVMKFGGSSVEDAHTIRRVAGIVKEHSDRKPVVVVSAMSGTTDRLLNFAKLCSQGRQYEAWQLFDTIQQQHFDAAADINDDPQLEEFLKKLFRNLYLQGVRLSENGAALTPLIEDEIVSYGEQLSSRLVTSFLSQEGLGATLVDVRKLIVTDSRFTCAQPAYWETYARIRRSLPHLVHCGRIPVLAGFIAANENGETTTLGRGGSDFSAALIGAGINAEEIQIWSDVDGMLTCDPRVFPNGKTLTEIAYPEAEEMAKAGAKVLHPHTVAPAARLRIPIVVLNSRQPQNEGTRIVARTDAPANPVKSIACIQNVDLLKIRPMAEGPLGDLAESIERCLEQAQIEPELLCSDDYAVFVGISKRKPMPPLAVLPKSTSVRIQTDCAVITLIGDGSAT
jgi:aspartate kinase